MRKIIAQRMAEVKPGVPHFYVTVDIDMEEAVKVREQAKAAEVKISINDLIVKAAAMALRRQPKVNVSLQGDRLLQFHTADVGIAVAIEDGLIEPAEIGEYRSFAAAPTIPAQPENHSTL